MQELVTIHVTVHLCKRRWRETHGVWLRASDVVLEQHGDNLRVAVAGRRMQWCVTTVIGNICVNGTKSNHEDVEQLDIQSSWRTQRFSSSVHFTQEQRTVQLVDGTCTKQRRTSLGVLKLKKMFQDFKKTQLTVT